MKKVTADDKKKFSQKLFEFQKKGLLAYGKYLDEPQKVYLKSKCGQDIAIGR